MFSKVVLVALVAMVVADKRSATSFNPPQDGYNPPTPSYSAPRPSYHQPEPVAPAKYDFDWAVKDDYSGNDFGQQESRDGDNTEGSYYVQLSDGRLQKVTYTVNGDSGFVVQVEYVGEAQSHQSKPRPSYQQPKPQPTYQQPKPQPTYQQPQPQPTYQQPQPSYG